MNTIPLHGKYGEGLFALVDDGAYLYLSQFKWRVNGGYAIRSIGKHDNIYMHRELVLPPKGFGVDHINGNTLDNRHENLRICTQAQNTLNRRPRTSGSTEYKGVYWSAYHKRWRAEIRIDGIKYGLGSYSDARSAAIAYNRAAPKYHGEFARLNKVD